ncbi:response regulator transcription factor [Zunongwangia sp. H14]|uniref:response regulator transcription factor n=1 Tax=Zunongwangia sp. H14 TaxID=3240792 RepID=UPI0035655CE7
MQKDFRKISEYWQETYSRQVKEYRPFKVSEDFKKFASVFAPGNSYFYIVNLHNFKLEYVSDSVKNFINKEVEELELKDLLETVIPEELEILSLKSKVISDFYTSYLDKEQVLAYKNLFSYKMKDAGGQIRSMLYQAFPLNVVEDGTPEHVMCIQTDVSHLQVNSTSTVSFIHMNGGKCYFNIDISKGMFDPHNKDENDFSELLTERERQIVIQLSRGCNAEEIAERLNVSPHTIKTHRRNVLRKSGCTNTTELVAKCLTNGIISPGLN